MVSAERGEYDGKACEADIVNTMSWNWCKVKYLLLGKMVHTYGVK